MAYPLLSTCPVCGKQLKIAKLECTHCRTVIENHFELSKFAALSKDQLQFIEIFLKCRGNIKEVEKEMGASYPTIRRKLDEVIAALGFSPERKTETIDRKKVIAMLERVEITAKEAIELLKGEDF